MRYAVMLAYDGTEYCGWQVQNNGRTVQEEVEKAFFAAFGERVRVKASGRTDAGVHSQGQIFHADLGVEMDGARLADALNAKLPADISALKSCRVSDGFDANSSVKKKTYAYRMYFGGRRNPLMDRYACFVRGSADLAAMRRAAALFVGEHDFAAYCASGSSAKTTVRTIYSAEISEENGCVVFRVCGNGFLYNMVRTLAGTLLGYAGGRLSLEDIKSSLEEGDRDLVGRTMPPNGLTLESVDYGFELFG